MTKEEVRFLEAVEEPRRKLVPTGLRDVYFKISVTCKMLGRRGAGKSVEIGAGYLLYLFGIHSGYFVHRQRILLESEF